MSGPGGQEARRRSDQGRRGESSVAARPFPPFPLASWPAGLLLLTLLAGCGYYSFTGASIPAHLSTVAIPLVENTSASPITGLDDRMTQLLQERFVGQTRLSLAESEEGADAVLSVRIDRYANQPTAVAGNDQALNRVTISVTVRYADQVEDRELLDRTFTGSAEYNPLGADGLQGEVDAAFAALENIADDIFTAATSNW